MKQRIVMSLILVLLIFLSGCNHNSFHTNTISKNETTSVNRELGKKLVRSITMYEQFELIGRFSALWVHNSIRSAAHKNNAQADTISFYLLSLSDVHFNEPSSEWKVGLKINDMLYQPLSIQQVFLPSVYQLFFGPHFSQYKVIYLIIFKAIDEEGSFLLRANTSMKLEISFEDRQGHMIWNFNERAVLMPHFESIGRRGN